MEKAQKLPYKVTATTDNGAKKAIIHLSQSLTLDDVAAVKLLMLQNFDKFQSFEVKIDDVEAIDLGIVQLLYSFKWTAERKSKVVHFNISLADEHKMLLERAGFSELVNN